MKNLLHKHIILKRVYKNAKNSEQSFNGTSVTLRINTNKIINIYECIKRREIKKMNKWKIKNECY